MATRLGSAGPLRLAIRSASKTSHQQAVRQLSCTALRAKDVASQDQIPNLRHAPRPRKSYLSKSINLGLQLTVGCSWRTALCPYRQSRGQVYREIHQSPCLRPIPPLMLAKIHTAILSMERRTDNIHPSLWRHSRHILPEISYRCRVHYGSGHYGSRLPHKGPTL